MSRVFAALALAAPILWSCGPSAEGIDIPPPGEPQYGGVLDVGTVYVTLSALSWDTADWSWKQNHDTGAVYEQLFAADLSKAVSRGGIYPFRAEAWLPADAMRGELAESWEWEGPTTLVVHLREGVFFTGKPGVMERRELVADDVVFSFQRSDASPKKIATLMDHVERIYARDDHTVVFELDEYRADWAYRWGYGYYSGTVPRELAGVDAKDWRNVVGTGPFTLDEYVQGNRQVYRRNPDYWDREAIDGKSYEIPFVDEVRYRIIKDEATFLTALRTGKLDILEVIRWIPVEHLKETTPELQWARFLAGVGTFVALRVDQKPFDDRRVRRALNLAVDHQEIVDQFFGGHGELLNYPMHPDFEGYYQPLEEMPESVQELFGYDPEKARRLLAEAGYPDGFTFETQVCSCNPSHMDLVPLLVSYLEKVGVTMKVKPLEYGAFLSTMTTGNHGPGYLMDSGHVNPIASVRKNFLTGQLWNPSKWSNVDIDARLNRLMRERDEEERKRIIRGITVEMLDQAPYIWLPSQYLYSAWWPWVRNYGGELRAGAVRPGPIYARLWIDHELKREMGFE